MGPHSSACHGAPCSCRRTASGGWRRAAFMLLLPLQVLASPLAAQAADSTPLGPKDGLIAGGAAMVWAVPLALSWNDTPSPCAPCDPAGLPFFDRWAIHEPQAAVSRASDVTRALVALTGWIDLAGEGRAGEAAVVASIESTMWAEALTQLLKGAVGRKRPVLYTDLAPDVADVRTNQRSMPSGHTSTAFALATSYWLSRRALTERDRPWLRWTLMAGAAGVAALRVAAGKHHPSDVVVGAGLGVASAIVIHKIKF